MLLERATTQSMLSDIQNEIGWVLLEKLSNIYRASSRLLILGNLKNFLDPIFERYGIEPEMKRYFYRLKLVFESNNEHSYFTPSGNMIRFNSEICHYFDLILDYYKKGFEDSGLSMDDIDDNESLELRSSMFSDIQYETFAGKFVKLFSQTFTHEFQHAYDSYVSKGNFTNKYNGKKYGFNTSSNDPKDIKRYYNSDHEVNARLTQAISDVGFNYEYDLRTYIKKVIDNFKHFKIIPEKKKKTLYRKITNFYHFKMDKFKNYMKQNPNIEGTPDKPTDNDIFDYYDYEKTQNKIVENITRKELNNFLFEYYEDYFQSTVNPEVKFDSAVYKTNFVIWYGTKGRSVIAPMELFDETEGNIFKDGKVDKLVELIELSDEPIELETSYCIPYKIDIVDICEILGSDRRGDYEYEYLSKKPSTGDSELDEYVSYYDDNDNMPIFEHFPQEFIPLMDKYQVLIARGKRTKEQFKKDLIQIVRNEGIDYSEAKEFYDYFLTKEHELYLAIKNNEGDLGSIRFQLRDGNHRYRACKQLGMSYMMCDLHIPENSSVTLEEIADRFEVR